VPDANVSPHWLAETAVPDANVSPHWLADRCRHRALGAALVIFLIPISAGSSTSYH
jgi:hypothetical protein